MTDESIQDLFYLIDQSKKYKPTNPTPLNNLIKQYNLENLTASLSRTKPDGSKNVKLRKSYKAHIQDLPGKHSIPSNSNLEKLHNLLDPNLSSITQPINPIDSNLLNNAIKFDKTPINGIPGFNVVDLAINDQSILMRSDEIDEFDENKSNKRKKKQLNKDEFKRQHI
ncbi:ROX3 [Candida pseudojiufengensis]|uniref:ROX3 n=1 Tax=Candida pseudojiufengensis TaxID=497109 RepID=UPI0022254C02|nr:ROX3 [Candida pseudojiufengensis]KAI5963040.1 ROX3 [Candida pseudojiufengensis]